MLINGGHNMTHPSSWILLKNSFIFYQSYNSRMNLISYLK